MLRRGRDSVLGAPQPWEADTDLEEGLSLEQLSAALPPFSHCTVLSVPLVIRQHLQHNKENLDVLNQSAAGPCSQHLG